MKKLFFAFALLSHFFATAQTQNSTPPKNAIYLILGGDALVSAQYGRIFYEKDKFSLDAKIGIGTTFSPAILGSGSDDGRSITHSVSAHFGIRHCLEAGVAGVYRFKVDADDESQKNGYSLYPLIGYKYRPARSGLAFRFTVQPIPEKDRHTWTFGVGVGFAF